jgi:hypothetical protein
LSGDLLAAFDDLGYRVADERAEQVGTVRQLPAVVQPGDRLTPSLYSDTVVDGAPDPRPGRRCRRRRRRHLMIDDHRSFDCRLCS